MPEYLTNDAPLAHLDFPPPVVSPPDGMVICPKCGGWGGHNLIVNAYPLRVGIQNTAENRHKYCHFRCQCDQCSGWGHVRPGEADCIHEWVMGRNLGRCLNEWRCTKCPKVRVVDSSD